jgi:hypothetical protein
MIHEKAPGTKYQVSFFGLYSFADRPYATPLHHYLVTLATTFYKYCLLCSMARCRCLGAAGTDKKRKEKNYGNGCENKMLHINRTRQQSVDISWKPLVASDIVYGWRTGKMHGARQGKAEPPKQAWPPEVSSEDNTAQILAHHHESCLSPRNSRWTDKEQAKGLSWKRFTVEYKIVLAVCSMQMQTCTPLHARPLTV